MTADPNIYEVIIHGPDSRMPPKIITVPGIGSPDELIDAAREMSRTRLPIVTVEAMVNGLRIAAFAGRWMWDTGNPDYKMP